MDLKYMQYNQEYLSLKYALVKSFLLPASRNILDISYKINSRHIDIQIVLLSGTFMSNEANNIVFNNFPNYVISIKEIYLTKEEFNVNKGEWEPQNYKWLDNLLFSKAEA